MNADTWPPGEWPAMNALKRSGRMDEAKAWILTQAEAGLAMLPTPRRIDLYCALEVAASRWLAESRGDQ
jgi:hypothetical protein